VRRAAATVSPDRPNVKILFASSEAVPLIKTGGLADVSGSLPLALRRLGHDVRVVLPAYAETLGRIPEPASLGTLAIPRAPAPVRLLGSTLDDSDVPVCLVDAPGLFDRTGNPYVGPDGQDWPDNALRFGTFCRAVAELALGHSGLGWQPDLVHCNDWQTGLVAPLLGDAAERPATLFTIHNLSYQGLFDRATFEALGLPAHWWTPNSVEFYGHLSFIKGGLALSDVITTVSPTYAAEIRQPHLGYGLHGLLSHRADRLYGILNGIDYELWNPETDPAIAQHYRATAFGRKHVNKAALQETFGLEGRDDALLFGHVGRLVEQKGVDLILAVLPRLMAEPDAQLAIIGSGNARLEELIRAATDEYPGRVGARLGYDEPLSHLLEAGSDAFLMPSRFEPCGLNQLFSLRYGTVPVVHRTGGLADTVVDATDEAIAAKTATGFVFDEPSSESLWGAVERALAHWRQPGKGWQQLAVTGMRRDYSWSASARRYAELYEAARRHAQGAA